MSSSISSTSSGSNLLTSILSSGSPTNISSGASTSSSSSSLAVTGLASGMDWSTVISELADAERSPETQWETQQSTLTAQNAAYTTLAGQFTTLQTDIETLQDSSLYNSTGAQSSNSTVATATGSSATLGNYTFNISQLATAATLTGAANVSQALSADNDPSSVTIGTAGFATPVTAGTFMVDGQQVSVATTDSLQDIFNAIATATSNKVTASYNSTTDEISLSSSDGSAVVLGSAADTSNFLQVAQLYNNGTDSVSSTSALGHVETGVTMTDSGLTTAITDGGSGNGAFTINGVTINYDASSDSIQDVLDDINNSAAGVTANYDSNNNSFTLTNNTTGDVGISVQDVTGNFLQATGLSGGTLQSGQNLLYTLNGSTKQLVSESNTIAPTSSGVSGLSVTALATGSATVNVSSDTGDLSTAIQQFVTDYNAIQTTITTDQAVTTSSSGTVTPGILTGDLTANSLASGLRSLVSDFVAGLSGGISMLSDLGIETNGQNNTLSVDTTTLNSAIANNLSSVQQLFNSPTTGLATQFTNYITDSIGTNGTITNHQASLTQQDTALTTQISNLETKITADTATWTSEFEAMETAESQANQELTYLSEQVTNGSL